MMTPVEIGQGKSFKGLAKYLLHDAKRDGEQARDTVERVGMVQSYNLDDASPDRAWRLMAATAKNANALKEAAGIKKGKTPVNTVYHYSINFNPKDELTPEIMEKAVAESLAALDMSHHQALAVEHTDTDHRHVHVMVNLIDPENGMSAATPIMQENGRKASKLSYAQKKFSAWAARFERENGLEITAGRQRNANDRQQGKTVDARRKSRNVYERDKREQNADRRRDFVKRQQNDRAREIQNRTKELKEQQRTDWTIAKEAYGVSKAAIKDRMSPTMKARSAEVKAEFKPEWAKLFKRHDMERRAFDRADRSLIGAIWHGAAVFKELAQDGQTLGAFVAAFSKEERRTIILRKHDRERKALGQQVGAKIAVELKELKGQFDREFSAARSVFLDRCSDLRGTHNQQWAEVREAWREYNATRSAAFSRSRGASQRLQREQRRAQERQRGRGLEP